MPVLVLGLVLQRGAVTGDWWRGLPNRELVAWGLTGFAAVTITGMVVAFTPGWWVAPVAGAGGAVNAALWRRVVVAAVNRPVRLRRVPGAVLVSVALVAALAPAGSVAGWAVAAASTPGPPITGAGVAAVHGPVIYIAGYDSVYHGPSRRPGLPLEHFSYRGLDARGRPLPYGAADTQEPLAISAGILSRQVEQAHRASGRMVALVAQSEGTLVARAYLESHPHPPVDAVAFLSPLVRPGRVYFPPRDAASGWGIASGWVLRGMLAVVNWAGGTQIFADAPFVRSVLDSAPVYRNRMLCPVPGVRMVAFIPLVSAAVVPPGRYASIPVVGVPGWHASLLGRGDVQRDLLAFLAGRTPDSAPGLLYPVVQRAAAAWQAPALALSVNPVWRAAKRPDASFGDDGCAAR